MKPLRFYSCLAVIILIAGCMTPNQYEVLETRVAIIEQNNSRRNTLDQANTNDLGHLRQQVDEFSKITRENYAEVKYDIQQLKDNFHRIQGQLEEVHYKFGINGQTRQESLEKRLDRLDNAISKNYEKVIALEKYMGFEPSVSGSSGQNSNSVSSKMQDTEDGLYSYAKQLFDQGDLENAKVQFENFISKYPDSKNADNARFWIADSYYAQKWYEKAILEYQKVLENYPDSNKNAAARLKQGYAFSALGEKANARLILKELISRYPNSQEAKYAKEKLKNIN
ncbi:MAG: tol-pal system protein YbgF [Desulfobacter postgatei]|uniref:Tol-pal system protein YbgF n=1 Tax=Desulfobacter postgatei TaxID=2293 RepID=A0A2G6MRS6_9BACT|nr:MAG: tol-pal system protein YbgF [Desulfobacter postgatei]